MREFVLFFNFCILIFFFIFYIGIFKFIVVDIDVIVCVNSIWLYFRNIVRIIIVVFLIVVVFLMGVYNSNFGKCILIFFRILFFKYRYNVILLIG